MPSSEPFTFDHPSEENRRFAKRVCVFGPICVAIGLGALAPMMNPVHEGSVEEFWDVCCGVRINGRGSYLCGPSLIVDGGGDGYFYYHCLQPLYRVRKDQVYATWPQVKGELEQRMAMVLDDTLPPRFWPDLQAQGYLAWRETGHDSREEIPLLAEKILSAVAGNWDGDGRERVAAEASFLIESYGRSRRYALNLIFEFFLFSGLIWFLMWPVIRGSRYLRHAAHWGALPLLFFLLPSYFGYAAMSFISNSGPSGGVGYAWILAFLRNAPMMEWERAMMPKVPPILDPISQGVRFDSEFFEEFYRVPGPIEVMGLGLAIFLLVMIIGAFDKPSPKARAALGS